MALTYSPLGQLGSPCPNFFLPSVDGTHLALRDFAGVSALVVMFICNHCPYVQAIEDRLITLAHEYKARGVAFVGICANDPQDYPEDALPALAERWREKKYDFPYLIDEAQSVARAFGAVCTPDLYVFDREHKLRYRGRLDDSWKNHHHVKRQELKASLEALLTGKQVNPEQNPSMGCSIKWKKDDSLGSV